jgi:hypothetical protein
VDHGPPHSALAKKWFMVRGTWYVVRVNEYNRYSLVWMILNRSNIVSRITHEVNQKHMDHKPRTMNQTKIPALRESRWFMVHGTWYVFFVSCVYGIKLLNSFLIPFPTAPTPPNLFMMFPPLFSPAVSTWLPQSKRPTAGAKAASEALSVIEEMPVG